MQNEVIQNPVPIDTIKVAQNQPAPTQPIQQPPHQPVPQLTTQRTKKVALIQDPDTLEKQDLDALAKKPFETTTQTHHKQSVDNHETAVTANKQQQIPPAANKQPEDQQIKVEVSWLDQFVLES